MTVYPLHEIPNHVQGSPELLFHPIKPGGQYIEAFLNAMSACACVGITHVAPKPVLVLITLLLLAKAPGTAPQTSELLLSTRRVTAVIPAGQPVGISPISLLKPRFMVTRLLSVLHCGGRVPVKLLI